MTHITGQTSYLIGVDYGSDSVRAILVDAVSGERICDSEFEYPRWKEGRYSDSSLKMFRHSPLDYIEGLEAVLKTLVSACPAPEKIAAISIDTTASTPCLVDSSCRPLALMPGHKENPDAMFVLWKDHSAESEADEINRAIEEYGCEYSSHSGGYYSAECFWAKVLKLLRNSPHLQKDAFTAIELCDWIPALLTGVERVEDLCSSLCAAGSKKMWAEEWGGYPPVDFFSKIDYRLSNIVKNLPSEVFGSDKEAGNLSKEWAALLGLSENVKIGVGNIDSHSGAVGAGVSKGTMVMNLGTSACFMAVMPSLEFGKGIVEGIFGQVEGSIIPGMTGFEAGMSAFGDIFAWLKRTLSWASGEKQEEDILKRLAREASELKINERTLIATDYFNGRRSPRPDSSLTGSLSGLTLGTKPAEIYYALAEAAAFGSRAIIEHFKNNGIEINKVVAVGGIAQKSPFIMQLISDVISAEILVSDCNQSCALGAAINAAVVAGLYPDVPQAQKSFCPQASFTYFPDSEKREILNRRYCKYLDITKLK